MIGNLAGARSPARRETGLLGLELAAASDRPAGERAVIPLDPRFEHGLIARAGEMAVGDDVVRPGALAYLGAGRDELALGLVPGSRALLLGGRPFGEDLLMWWNFVARSRSEIEQAWTEWEHGTPRLGRVALELDAIAAPRPSWLPAE